MTIEDYSEFEEDDYVELLECNIEIENRYITKGFIGTIDKDINNYLAFKIHLSTKKGYNTYLWTKNAITCNTLVIRLISKTI